MDPNELECEHPQYLVLWIQYYIGVMIPSWILYPVFAVGLRSIAGMRTGATWSIPPGWLLALFAPAVTWGLMFTMYFSNDQAFNRWIHSHAANPFFVLFNACRGIFFWMMDFIVGAGGAELAYRLSTIDTRNWVLSERTWTYLRIFLADTFGVTLALYATGMIGEGNVFEGETGILTQMSHNSTVLWSIYLCLSHGTIGGIAWLISRRSLSALGETALEVYCLQNVTRLLLMKMQLVANRQPESFMVEIVQLLATWFVAWLFGEAIGKPVTRGLMSFVDWSSKLKFGDLTSKISLNTGSSATPASNSTSSTGEGTTKEAKAEV